jgi:hypothetical protein
LLVRSVPEDGLVALQQEIAAEKVSSLARVAERLEAALAQLPSLAALVLRAGPEERPARVAAYNAMRARAAEAYYFMTVQREAMHLPNHDELARHYRIPPPLR